MTRDLMQIGEVAERTRLSLRTIRYYEEVGLTRDLVCTSGGFRLYTDADVDRLRFVRRLKPLALSLEQIRDLVAAIEGVPRRGVPGWGVGGTRDSRGGT